MCQWFAAPHKSERIKGVFIPLYFSFITEALGSLSWDKNGKVFEKIKKKNLKNNYLEVPVFSAIQHVIQLWYTGSFVVRNKTVTVMREKCFCFSNKFNAILGISCNFKGLHQTFYSPTSYQCIFVTETFPEVGSFQQEVLWMTSSPPT